MRDVVRPGLVADWIRGPPTLRARFPPARRRAAQQHRILGLATSAARHSGSRLRTSPPEELDGAGVDCRWRPHRVGRTDGGDHGVKLERRRIAGEETVQHVLGDYPSGVIGTTLSRAVACRVFLHILRRLGRGAFIRGSLGTAVVCGLLRRAFPLLGRSFVRRRQKALQIDGTTGQNSRKASGTKFPFCFSLENVILAAGLGLRRQLVEGLCLDHTGLLILGMEPPGPSDGGLGRGSHDLLLLAERRHAAVLHDRDEVHGDERARPVRDHDRDAAPRA